MVKRQLTLYYSVLGFLRISKVLFCKNGIKIINGAYLMFYKMFIHRENKAKFMDCQCEMYFVTVCNARFEDLIL